jgi:Fe-S cluster assembly iron-binding protein IscA
METNKSYIKTDNNTLIQENSIRWIEKKSDCLQICIKATGCSGIGDTFKICKENNPNAYNKFNKYFIEDNNLTINKTKAKIDNISYIRADNNIIIQENSVRWIKKMSDCLEVCAKFNGCTIGSDTLKICKENSTDSYNKFNSMFE